jgi:hypothetical protein
MSASSKPTTVDMALQAMKESLREGMSQMPSVTSEQAYAQARHVLYGETKSALAARCEQKATQAAPLTPEEFEFLRKHLPQMQAK